MDKTNVMRLLDNFETIYFSAGRVGAQVEVAPKKAIDYIGAVYTDIII